MSTGYVLKILDLDSSAEGVIIGTERKFLLTAFMASVLVLTTIVAMHVIPSDATTGGGSDPLQDTVTVELEMSGNVVGAWGTDAYIVVTHDGVKTEYKNSKSLQVSKGSEIVIEVFEGDDGRSSVALEKISVQIGNRQYCPGIGTLEGGQYNNFSSYVFEVDEDMSISMLFSINRPVNPVEIVNKSGETLHLLGGLTVG